MSVAHHADPRHVRSREALEAAVLDLARTRPVSAISPTEIAERAGVSRPTFYAHARSATDLLASVFERELGGLREDFERRLPDTPAGQATMLDPERALVRHVHEHADIYRRNLVTRLPGGLRDVLIDQIERGLREHVLAHPEIVPAPHDDPGTAGFEREVGVYAAIAASGTVAGIERWLSGPDPLDEEWIVEVLIRGNAEWWERPVGSR